MNMDSSRVQEILVTSTNRLDKPVYVSVQCYPNSKYQLYAAVGATLVSVDQVDFGCGKQVTLPAGYVGGIDFILNSGSELATILVDVTSNALKMSISVGLAFAATVIGLVLF